MKTSIVVILILEIGSTVALSQISRNNPEELLNAIVLLDDDTGGGTGFELKYKEKIFTLTAGHVCDKDKFMTGHFFKRSDKKLKVLKVLKVSENPDLCALEGFGTSYLQLTKMYKPYCDIESIRIGFPKLEHMRIVKSLVCNGVSFSNAIPGESGSPILDKEVSVIGLITAYFDINKHTYSSFEDNRAIENFLESL